MNEKQRQALYRQAEKQALREVTPGQREAALARLDQADRDWLAVLPEDEVDLVVQVLVRFPGTVIE